MSILVSGQQRISLRPYQEETIRASFAAWRAGHRSILAVLPTGAGKTIVFAEMARLVGTKGRRTLILAHREELLSQAIQKIGFVWPTARIGLIRASNHIEGADITVASIQSLHSDRLHSLSKDYALIVTDEAHHAAAPTYRRVYDFLSGSKHLGVTATPKRADGKGLKEFEKVVYRLGIPELIAQGYLCPMIARTVKLDLNMDSVSLTKQGDFNLGEMGRLFSEHQPHAPVVTAWFDEKAKHGVTKGLAFCVDVDHAMQLSNAFHAAGVRAHYVHGEMKSEDRRAVLRAFHDGSIEVLTNCNVLTEGFDEPAVDCLLMVKPTRSSAMYIQMVGRGLRLYPGKDVCRVVDFAGVTRHKLVQAGDCLKDDHGVVQTSYSTPLHWARGENGYILQAESADGIRYLFRLEPVEEATKQNADLWRVTLRKGRGEPIVISEAPLSWAQGQAEEEARRIIPKDKLWLHRKDAPWRKGPPTDKQASWFKSKNLPIPATKGEASDLMTRLFNGG